MSLEALVHQTFQERYGEAPAHIARAPGRVNLIGEHTDYNDGFVLPMAIDRAAWIAFSPRNDHRVRLYSVDFQMEVDFTVDDLTPSGEEWHEYVKGIAWALENHGHKLTGWDGVVAGNVPIGAGLSSSAALELAAARVFATTSNIPWDAAQMARLSQYAENRWVGVNCGIMDQMISAAGAANHALLIDCRSLATELVPLPPQTAVVVLDTSTRRGLVDSAYNERRAQCEEAAQFFNVAALRDVSLTEFNARAGELPPLTRQRARHVISENERTLAAVAAMRQGDAVRMGALMDASHASLRDDFAVTNDALNQIVSIARSQAGCFGARMTGAGFGGCAVALVAANATAAFAANVTAAYTQATGLTPSVYICSATDGAALVG